MDPSFAEEFENKVETAKEACTTVLVLNIVLQLMLYLSL